MAVTHNESTLTCQFVDDCIDEVIGETNESFQQAKHRKGLTFQRASKASEWNSLLSFVLATRKDDDSSKLHQNNVVSHQQVSAIPFYFGIGLHSGDRKNHDAIDVFGVLSFYIAYSTWDGRNLFIDCMKFQGINESSSPFERSILQMVAKIAVKLGCARMTWLHSETPSWYLDEDSNPPEILREWLVLKMDRPAMIKYCSSTDELSSHLADDKSNNEPGYFDRLLVEETIAVSLLDINKSNDTKFQIRLATGDDMETIAGLVTGLAIYENEPDAVHVTAKDYILDGGCSEKDPLFYCLLFDHCNRNHTCAMAFLYFGYSLGVGRFLYLEDLFFEEAYRRQGGGSFAMKSLARLSLALRCTQFCWAALDWNAPALNLYEKIGAKVQEGCLITRYCGENLKSLADA